jgi:hypothetical protein
MKPYFQPVTPGNEFRIAVNRGDIKPKPTGHARNFNCGETPLAKRAGQIGDAAQTPSDRGYGREASAL